MLLNEMAMDKKQWEHAASKALRGALGEYAKLRYFKEYGLQDFWSNEVKRLLKVAESLLDKKTKSNFDKYRAFYQVYEDCDDQSQIVAAKNQIVSEYLKNPSQRMKFLSFFKTKTFDAKILLDEMIKEFSPIIKQILYKGQLSESGIWQWNRDLEILLTVDDYKVKLFSRQNRFDNSTIVIEINGKLSEIDKAECMQEWIKKNQSIIEAYWNARIEESDVVDILNEESELNCVLVGNEKVGGIY